VTIADVDWARFTPPFTLRRPSPLLTAVPEAVQAVAAAVAGAAEAGQDSGSTGWAAALAALPPAEQDQAVTDLVRAGAAQVLGHASASAVETGKAFKDLGIDSLTALELSQHLTRETGLRMPATLVFDYPTPAAVARYMCGELLGAPAEQTAILQELDKLQSALAAIAADDDYRSRVITRLEAVLQDFRAGTPDNIEALHHIDSATDDEIFDILDKELGI
jgi:acyl carrier protein